LNHPRRSHSSPPSLPDALPIYVADLEPGLVGVAPRRHALDLGADLVGLGVRVGPHDHADAAAIVGDRVGEHARRPRSTWRLLGQDRKSTRLNSSHEWISYAVFC